MKKYLFIALVLSTLLLSACGGGSSSSSSSAADSSEKMATSETKKAAAGEKSGDDTFTFAIDSDPLSLNPISANDRWGMTSVNMMFSPLARTEGDGTVKNELAETIEKADDGLSVTATLKDDLHWSDGEPITADDVVFTYETKIDKDNGASDSFWLGDESVKVEKIDDKTVKFVLPEVDVPLLNGVATDTYIIPKHVYEGKDFKEAEVDVEPVGSGPYKLVENKKGEYLKFEANDSYYGGAPKLKNTVLRIISNPDTAKVAIQNGEVDAGLVQPSDVAEMEKKDLQIQSYSENRVGYMGINCNSDKLKNEDLRKGIFYAINKPEMNKAAYLNEKYYVDAYSILPPSNAFYNDDVEKYEQNIEKAKELVKEADAEGTELNLGYMTGDNIQKLQVNFIKQALEEAGLKVNLSAVETAALVSEMQKPDTKKYDMYISGYIWGNDPDGYKSQFKSDGDFNIMHYENKDVDKLFEEGAKELDEDKRKEIYDDLQEEIADDAVFYPIVDNKKIVAANPKVTGFEEARFVPIYIMEDWSKLSK